MNQPFGQSQNEFIGSNQQNLDLENINSMMSSLNLENFNNNNLFGFNNNNNLNQVQDEGLGIEDASHGNNIGNNDQINFGRMQNMNKITQ